MDNKIDLQDLQIECIPIVATSRKLKIRWFIHECPNCQIGVPTEHQICDSCKRKELAKKLKSI